VQAGLVLGRGGPGANEEAETLLRDALAIARRQHARLFELRAAIELAKLLLEQSRDAEARAELAPAYAAFTDGCDFLYLKQARALLGGSAEEAGAAPVSDLEIR
jgi:adenylate cyclase